MKKNLISVITLALCLVNLVLTAVMAIAIIPSAQKSNELITKVANAIDLELTSGDTTSASDFTADQLAMYDIADSLTINLKKGADGANHYAVINVTLYLYTSSEDYETYSADLAAKESLVKNTINDVVSSYTLDELQNNKADVCKDILEQLRELYNGSDFIAEVNFTGTYQ